MCVVTDYLVSGPNPVPDSSITASSSLDYNMGDFRPISARLDNLFEYLYYSYYDYDPGSWAPSTTGAHEYIQAGDSENKVIDFKMRRNVCSYI